MNHHLLLAGLAPIPQGCDVNPYDDLGRKIIQKELKSLNRDTIELLCRANGLWIGRTIEEPDAVRIGIRSFWLYAEHIEDETDATLCLLCHFNGRSIKAPEMWNRDIISDIDAFLQEHVKSSQRYHIRLQTHGSIAFLAGWKLNPKSSVDIVPLQDSFTGRHIWRNVNVSPTVAEQYPSWQVTHTNLKSSNGTDTVIAISVSHNIGEDVLSYVKQNVKTSSRFIHCFLSAPGPASVADGTHAHMLAQGFVASVRKILIEQGSNGVLHVFFSAPNGLMFIIGRFAHVLGELLLYEYNFEAGGASYQPSIRLTPNRHSCNCPLVKQE